VGDFNLLRLSSVIPAGAEVREVSGKQQLVGAHGDRLYCVYAEAYASTPFEQAWAGVAWSRSDDDSGEGLFVEHTGASEATVRHDLQASLADLSARRGGRFHQVGLVMDVAECVDHPVCAVVVATYSHTSWTHRVD
jgi:arginine decarboxylase